VNKNFEIPSTNEVMELLAKRLSGNSLSFEETESIGRYYILKAPQHIYRYRPANLREIEALTKNKIWFSRISELNDPFESHFNIDIESIISVDNDIKNTMCNMSFEEKQAIFEIVSNTIKGSSDYQKVSEIFNDGALACFSEKNNSLLMWGHYANGHRGICVEYNTIELNRTSNKTIIPVDYSDKLPVFASADETSVIRFFLQTIRTKCTDWDYEDEWRCVQDKGACGENWSPKGALLDSSPPTAIYVGCEADDVFVEYLAHICKNTLKIPLYKMTKSKDEYKLLPKLIT